jgi:hypothetical protein
MFAKDADDTSHLRIVRVSAAQQVGLQLGILNAEQPLKCPLLLAGSLGITQLVIALQQLIEFTQAAPALPRHTTQCRRSARSFLISPIALAGLRSLGQASVQFMIV